MEQLIDMGNRFRTTLLLLACVTTTANFATAQTPPSSTQTDSASNARTLVYTQATSQARFKLLQDISGEKLNPELTVGEYLSRTESSDRLQQTINEAQPIGGARWINDATCQVKIELAGPQLATVLTIIAKEKSDTAPIPADALELRLREWQTRSFVATGFARVDDATGSSTTTNIQRAVAPALPPRWVSRQLDADAVSPSVGGKLKTAQAAERLALNALRAKVDQLKLDDHTTLADAAKLDPGFAESVNNAMLRAKVFKVDYRPDGSVGVKIFLDGGDLWNTLRFAR